MLRQVRSVDLVAQLGGEEFVAVMPETNLAGAVVVAERLRQAVSAEPFTIQPTGLRLPVTISIGVAASNGPGETVENLLKRADDALYEAKRNGRNRVLSLTTDALPLRPMPLAS